MVFAQRIPAARQPYWVDQWENNPQQRSSLSHISQVTKDQVRELVDLVIPPLATPWNQVPLMDGTVGLGQGEPMIGAVVGPVQSGKTASMVGLISHLYDIGYDAVVVMTGRTNDLNLQTAIRLKNDVFDWGEPITRGRVDVRPSSPFGLGSHKNPPIFNSVDFYSTPLALDTGSDWNGWFAQARTALSRLVPSLLVTKKTAGRNGSLLRMTRTMRQLDQHCQQTHNRSLRWAIIDDECDSLSVGAEDSVTPALLHNTTTIGECVYIGYSATPQANLFAVQNNPLFPRHFAFFLRTGHYWDGNDPHPPLEICYQVDSINKMYCGGWVFYNFCDAVGINNYFQEETPLYNPDVAGTFAVDDIKKPLMHYLLTGGARWLLGGELPFHQVPQPLGTDFPSPHSMLINPHDRTHGHRQAATWLINAIRQSAGLPLDTIANDADWQNRGQGLWTRARALIPQFIQNNQPLLQTVYDEISQTFTDIEAIRARNPQHVARQFPSIQATHQAALDIASHIKLKILNGNHRGDRLDYDVITENGTVTMPEDVYTIAIGGVKLGRGITLSGLCTTLFLTSSGRADDSAVQMQRWFGYRGSHIEFVKVYCPNSKWESSAPQNYDGLRERNNHLQDIYELVCRNWGSRSPPNQNNPVWSVLIGQATNLSNRVTQQHTFPIHDPLSIINYIHPSSVNAAVSQSNLVQIGNLYAQMIQKGMPPGLWDHNNGRTLGIFCGIPFDGETHQNDTPNGARFSADEVATFLDSLQWPNHNPSNNSIRHPYQVPANKLPTGGFRHRQPNGQTNDSLPVSKDPYLLATYLRMWESAYRDNVTRTNNGTLANLSQDHITHGVTTPPPEFNILIRQGGSQLTHTFAPNVTIRCRRYRGNINLNTGALSAYTWVAANKQLNYGTDKRADDIRGIWPMGNDWSISRNAIRSGSNRNPGLILISLIDDNNGIIAPVIHYSIPSGGPPVRRYI